ncbi:MAG: type III pantothenate kinase [Roseburia sp.]
MIITIDVGNTNITVGVFQEDEVLATFRITTKMPRTSDEYGMVLVNLLEQNGIHREDIMDAIIASVVPNVMHALHSAIIKDFGINPIIVEPGIKTGIRIVTENPRQIGADRIVDAAAAYELYGGPVLVLDFGTATTYDLVDKDGAFVSGVTAPGIGISAKALWEDAAKLPEIEIRKPASILAKETISSMQAGLVYGQIGQTEYIVRHMIEEAHMGEVKVVATGGLGRIIASETDMIDVYDPNLTLKGMNLIYKKQNRKSGRIRCAGSDF